MKVMNGSFAMHRYNFSCSFCRRVSQLLVMAFAVSVLLIACGDEDPILSSTDTSPILEDFAIAYIKRPVASLVNPRDVTGFPEELDVDNGEGLIAGDVYLRDLSSPSAKERPLTTSLTQVIDGLKSAGDVSGLEVSYDGTKLLFALHEGLYEGRDDDEQPTWNIWEYDLTADENVNPLRQIIAGALIAEEGNDVDPHYLPDGRIVFTSDRQARSKSLALDMTGNPAVSLDEDRRNPAFVLHVMDADGSNITQISFNQSNDLNPTVLQNGKILFSRWDHLGGRNEFSLYQVNPDGRDFDVTYGAHSHDIGLPDNERIHFIDVREMQNGRLLATIMPRSGTRSGGEMVFIDKENFVEIDTLRFGSTTQSTSGQESASNGQINPGAGISEYGRYTTPYPIWEPDGGDRVLVAWSICFVRPQDDVEEQERKFCTPENLADEQMVQADPFYGIYMFDLSANLKRPIVMPENGMAITNPVAILARDAVSRPTIIPNKTVEAGDLDADLVARAVGTLNIKSVYDTEGDLAMVDKPLEPRNSTTLTTAERQNILMTTVLMDPVTKGVFNGDVSERTDLVERRIANIPILSDPMQRTADQRPARFLRITKASPTLDEVNNNAFGRGGTFEMREILGYAEIEPDGSVYVEIPAEVPIALTVTDREGRALMNHSSWIQVMPGEERVCNGCHSPRDGQASINPGAPLDGIPFPNTVNIIEPQLGETMAETRKRLSCLADCSYPKLKMDITYVDVWTDPGLRVIDAPKSMYYVDPDVTDGDAGLATDLPILGKDGAGAGSSCDEAWDWAANKCRISINYPDHIQPLWDVDRLYDFDNDLIVENYRCTTCHNNRDEADVQSQVPAGDLNLKLDTLNGNNRLPSYDQLFDSRPTQELDANGNLRVKIIRDANDNPVLDADGNEQLVDPLRPAMVSIGVARARFSRLVQVITGEQMRLGNLFTTPNFDHTRILTDGEKRLIIEWIDIGSQYYNDPFSVPAN
ncbi:MAG: hypothetical protein GXP08_02815 [Gammaproteobacteria bacterium]|nr:hypothetical protein [Gammaproteobacteria bacterium]